MKFICLNCDTELEYKRNNANKYCNNKCQKEHERNLRIQKWLEESVSWKGSIPNWARHYLISSRGYKCEVCGIDSWNGDDLILECDHIDGIHFHNEPSNLRLICPNCHSQTKTYKNKNRGNGRTLNAPKA